MFYAKKMCVFEIHWRVNYKGCLLHMCFYCHPGGQCSFPSVRILDELCATVTTCVKNYGLWRSFLLAWGVCEITQKLSMDSIYCLIFDVGRGASRGFVWLSWQTPLHRRYSALQPIKYQTLSLQVSNAGVLEQATVYISLVTLHTTITKQQR